MKQFFNKMRSATGKLMGREHGVSALEFTLIAVLVTVAILASLESSSGTLELLLGHLAGGLAP